MPLLVRSMTVEAAGVLSVELVDPDGHDLPPWEPGAHLDLHLPGGLSRQYSLSGDPSDRSRYRLGILREDAGRGGSAYVHEALRPGDHVDVGGPRNHFRLEPAATYVFVAGGIGITPILPMLAEATAAGVEWTLLYGGRTAASMAFTDRARGVRRPGHPAGRRTPTGCWTSTGCSATPRPDTLVYACGPEPLLAAVEAADGRLAGRRAAPGAVRGAGGSTRDPVDEHAVEVVLAESGRTVLVPP